MHFAEHEGAHSIPVLGRQRQVGLCEYETNLAFIVPELRSETLSQKNKHCIYNFFIYMLYMHEKFSLKENIKVTSKSFLFWFLFQV